MDFLIVFSIIIKFNRLLRTVECSVKALLVFYELSNLEFGVFA